MGGYELLEVIERVDGHSQSFEDHRHLNANLVFLRWFQLWAFQKIKKGVAALNVLCFSTGCHLWWPSASRHTVLDLFLDFISTSRSRFTLWLLPVAVPSLTLWQLDDPNADSGDQISKSVFSDGVAGKPWQDGQKLQQEALHSGTRTPGGTRFKRRWRVSELGLELVQGAETLTYPLTHQHCAFTLSKNDRDCFPTRCPRTSSCVSSRATDR